MDTTASGRFWLCPVCRKHVPSRNDKCQCGFDRTTVNVPMREAAVPSIQGRAEAGAAEGGSSLPWLAGLALAVVASLWLWKAGKDSERANAELRDRTAERRASQEQPQQQPQVMFVPQPTADGVPTATVEPVAIEALSAAALPSPNPAGWVAPQVARAAVEVIRFAPQESEVDVKRRNGIVEFEQSMIQLSDKADRADVAWGRFIEGCRVNVTTAFAAAGVADRDWIAVAYVGVTTRTWTESCAEAGAFFGLTGQVRDGMCVAEDRARMAWVLPGTRRELRHKYRLEWDGWDRICQS